MISVGDIIEARVFCLCSNQMSVNGFHFSVASLVGTPTDAQLAQCFDVTVGAAVQSMVSSDATYRGTGVRYRHAGLWSAIVYSNVGAGGGGDVGGCTSKQTCGINTWTTGIAGRAGRGRTYWPFVAVTRVTTNGEPTAAYGAGIDTICSGLLGTQSYTIAGGATGVTATLGLFHRGSSTISTITGYTVRGAFATQRRRGDYGKANVPPI